MILYYKCHHKSSETLNYKACFCGISSQKQLKADNLPVFLPRHMIFKAHSQCVPIRVYMYNEYVYVMLMYTNINLMYLSTSLST